MPSGEDLLAGQRFQVAAGDLFDDHLPQRVTLPVVAVPGAGVE